MSRLYTVLLLLAGAFLLCGAGFYNGFPLVYSDTGTYLESGFTLETPLDRPIAYGLLLRLFSLNGVSVWSVIFCQSLLLVTLIYLCAREFNFQKSATMIAAAALVLFTGVSWVASELIADVFTPITVLTCFLLLFGNKYGKAVRVLLYVILLVAVACHISHVMICIAMMIMVAIIRFIRKRKGLSVYASRAHMIGCVIVSLAAFATMTSSISKSRHVFMMGHLVETGILNAYLDDHCPSETISLCRYRDRIPPGAETFIWNSDGDSVLILTGGWLGSKDEYSRIISETFTTPEYLGMHVRAAVTGTLKQLVAIRVGEGMGRYDSTQLASQRLKKYFPKAYPAYLRSRQSADEIASLPNTNVLNALGSAAALLLIVVWLLMARKNNPQQIMLKTLVLFVAGAYLLNCAICATLATVANRFGARLSWMFVLLAVFIMLDLVASKRKALSV